MGFNLRATGEALCAPPAVLPCVDLALHNDDYCYMSTVQLPNSKQLRAQGRAATTYELK